MANDIKSARRCSWTRMRRFVLTEAGLAVEAGFRETIAESRTRAGRASFDEARDAWGRQFGVPADDAAFLAEMRSGACSSAALVAALDVCGKTREDVLAGPERLAEAGLIAES
ncbi:MAG: hypothetical protein OHK0013_46760 [Sandaracinaceae bacterium]